MENKSLNSQVRIFKPRYNGYDRVHLLTDLFCLVFCTAAVLVMYAAGHWDQITR